MSTCICYSKSDKRSSPTEIISLRQIQEQWENQKELCQHRKFKQGIAGGLLESEKQFAEEIAGCAGQSSAPGC